MQIGEQLRQAGVPTFPCWVRQRSDGGWDKGPKVQKGESWLDASTKPYNDPTNDWSTGVCGVPIPPGIVVLDLDSYKGVTRADVEHYLGTTLDWDAAAIQRTISGGEHYAFRCDWDVRQIQEGDLVGLDTRAPGRGFICSGSGYAPAGAYGVLALAYPAALPPMPDAARHVLERRAAPTAPTQQPQQSTADEEQIIEALRHIDPGCGRAEWVKVGLALRHHYQNNDAQGEWVFDQWSSGSLWHAGAPENYVPEHVPHQWGSFKAEGGVTISSLFYKAIQYGWNPPATFDTAAAFGKGVTLDAFAEHVGRIRTDGSDIAQTQSILDGIRAAGCNELQVALLAAELKAELKQAGVKDKKVDAHIDAVLQVNTPADMTPQQAPGMYGKSDPGNAATFLEKFYPGGRLVRSDGEFYAYNGKVWEKLDADMLKHMVAVDMITSGAQGSKINACIDLVSKLAPVYTGGMNKSIDGLIIFNNGVLEVNTGQLYAHSMDFKTTAMVPYDYNPAACCPEWLDFLYGTFEGDAERVGLLQEWLGYLLSSDYRHHKVMLLLGPKRSGKGTIGRVFESVVGTANFAGGSLSSFNNDAFIDRLRTKPVLFIGDAEKKVSNNDLPRVIERIKTISGNDSVDFNRKYLSGLSDTLPTRITIAANSVPSLFDDSGALASRMLVLPFYKSAYGNEDLHLIDRLLCELPGIAAWALEGLRRLQANGRFSTPAASVAEMDYLVENYSPLVRFLSECCVQAPDQRTSARDLYETYRAWALAEGEDPMRRRTFTGSIKDATRGAGVHYGTYEKQRGFSGLGTIDPTPTNAQAFKVVK